MTTEPKDTNEAVEATLPTQEASFAETALRMGGKSVEEAERTGAIDRADDQVEELFQPEYQTVNSPIHQAVWARQLPVELFQASELETESHVQTVMDDSVELVRRHCQQGSLLDENNKVSEAVLDDLGGAGYWGLLVDRKYGGSGASFRSFAPFLTRMALVDGNVAGLASVHGCIGAVDPLRTFGSAEQKERLLPGLARGERISAFALTEPGAGSDLTALTTTAVLEGDDYVVNGEKLFITNVRPGRTIGLVCLIDQKPAVLICELPEQENEHFQLRRYGLYALKNSYNQGIIFKDFRVPRENLLEPTQGNGLTIAYHGLNLGRIALCANSAASMRTMMAGMLPWAHYRYTYGDAIARRELVQRRLGRLAGLIVACDALVAWGSTLIDQGYRGEMECIIAKIFGSEMQKEAAIELCMKTHGGRSFLHGHLIGDNIHEYLAPCIYEGEGEMLGMAFFKSLVKQHGKQYFEPVGRALQAGGIRKPNMLNPLHLWKLKGALVPYAGWMAGEYLWPRSYSALPQMPENLKRHAQFAIDQLQRTARRISSTMRKHQLKLADRQCRMSELSARTQSLVVLLCTCLHAATSEDAVVEQAADVLAQQITLDVTGRTTPDRFYRDITGLGETILDGGFASLAGIEADEILMTYDRPQQG